MTPAEQSAFRDPDPAAPAVAYWGNVRVECSAEHQATLVSGANRYHIADLSIIGKVWDLQKQANSQFKAFFENTSIIYDLEIGYAIGGTPDLLARLLREGNHSEETVALAQAWCRDGSLRWCARCGSSFEIVDARLTPETRQRLARSMLAPATLPSTNPSSQSSPRAQEP